jgi:FKBP-type peptidyl-prolyl cis-trans isomerase SlyD
MVQAHMQNGGMAQLTLVKIEGDKATLDANHPFAGKTLNFEAEVLAIQEATEEDLAAAKQ